MLICPECPTRKVATVSVTLILFLSTKSHYALHTAKSLWLFTVIVGANPNREAGPGKLEADAVTSPIYPKTLAETKN